MRRRLLYVVSIAAMSVLHQFPPALPALGIGTEIGDSAYAGGPTPQYALATWAFAIWAPIYALTLAFGVYQALPRQRASAFLARLDPWILSLLCGSAAWTLVAVLWNSWLTLPVIVWMVVSAWGGYVLLTRMWDTLTRADVMIVVPMVSMYAAWLTAATFQNLSVLDQYPWGPAWLRGTDGSLALLVCSVAAGLVGVTVGRGNRWYVGTLVWAFAAIIAAARERGNEAVQYAAALALVATVVWGTAARRRDDADRPAPAR